MEHLELASNDEESSLPPERKQMAKGRPSRRTIPEMLHDTFIKGDAHDVMSYVMNDVAIPAAKDTIVTMITNGANLLFKGTTDSGPSGYYRSNGAVGTSKVDYGKPYRQSSEKWSSSRDNNAPPWVEPSRSRMRYVDVEFDTKEEAEDIRMAIYQDTVTYGMVPVRQLYEMAGLPWTSSDYDYGWSDVSSARIIPTRHKTWRLVMPAPEFLGD